jgi:pilus assembly protein CpaB
MRAKSGVLLLVALGCGLVAAIGVTQVITRNPQQTVSSGLVQSIVVATKDIASGELVIPQAVKLEPWPKEKIPAGSLGELAKVDGCRARVDIYQGEPLLEKKLLGKGVTRRTATDYIPKGYRVVAVKVDATSGGAGLIQPGDRVDVLVHLARSPDKGIPENRTQTILQDVKVFAVDDNFILDTTANEKDSIQAKVIQLLVTPEDAETLVMAQQLGKVQLVMRPPGDSEKTLTKGKTPAELLAPQGVGGKTRGDEVADHSAGGASGGLKGFLDGLKLTPVTTPATASPPVATPQNETWTMRLLSGSELTDVVLEESAEPSGEKVWKVGAGATPEPPTTPEPVRTRATSPAPQTPAAAPTPGAPATDKAAASDAAPAEPAKD